MKIRRLALLFLLGMSFVMAGCNTMEGVGEDMEEAGEEISDTANDMD